MSLYIKTPCEDYQDPPADIQHELLHDIFRADPERYWSRCPGDAGLHFSSAACNSQLVLLYVSGRGYFVSYSRSDDASEQALRHTSGSDDTVTIRFGGEPEVVSARMFVTPDEAWDVIRQFVENGERPFPGTSVEWVATGRV